MKFYSNLRRVLVCLLFLPLLVFFGACNEKIDYFDYVSELRSNIFLAENEDFSLRVYATYKESPYAADGIKRETAPRIEVFLAAPSGAKTCETSFSVNGKRYGGEMSFDNVRAEYYYACPLDVSEEQALVFEIVYGDSVSELTAKSVKTDATLAPKSALQTLIESENELFSSLTDKYGFAGEINIRLLYEEAAYYYIGIVDRNGTAYAFLINAQTGKILAKRQS